MTISTDSGIYVQQTSLQVLLQVAQLIEAFSRSYLPTRWDPACEHNPGTSSLRWWPAGQLVSRAIGSRRALRTGISLPDLTLQLIDQSSSRMARIQAQLPLTTLTPAQAAAWLETVLAEALPRGYTRSLRLPGWPENQPAFAPDPAALAGLTRLYDHAQQFLAELAESLELSCTPVRFVVLTGELRFSIHLLPGQPEIGFAAGGQTPPCYFVRPAAYRPWFPVWLEDPETGSRRSPAEIRYQLLQLLTLLSGVHRL